MHIDEYAIITNGILASNDSIKIIDPLGYYVIQIEEEIIDEGVGGGALDHSADQRKNDQEKEKKKKKIIRITVFSQENNIDFVKEIELQNIDLKITNVKMVDGVVHLELYNPALKEYTIKKVRVRIL